MCSFFSRNGFSEKLLFSLRLITILTPLTADFTREEKDDTTRISSTAPVLQTLANDKLDATRLVPRKYGSSRVLHDFLIWNSLTANLSRFAMRSSFIKVTTTNAVREENERERKERRESEREKNGKRDSFAMWNGFLLRFCCSPLKNILFGVGGKDMSRISSLKHTLLHSFLPRETREKKNRKSSEREHLNDTISISSKSSVCVSKASFVLHHLHPLVGRKRRFGKLRIRIRLGQQTMMEKKDDQESQQHRMFYYILIMLL